MYIILAVFIFVYNQGYNYSRFQIYLKIIRIFYLCINLKLLWDITSGILFIF